MSAARSGARARHAVDHWNDQRAGGRRGARLKVEQMVAAFRLVGEPDEHATILLVVQDELGADVKGHPLSLRLAHTGICDGHISLAPVEIPSFGKYSVALRLDGVDAFRTTFWVVEQ
jgi:hypothetical protein